jgi:hypothetical protein
MTKQEVVFCKSVFEKVKFNFEEQEIWASENYYRTLSFIKIKTLKTNEKTIERCIKESKGFLKIFKQHLFSDNLELIQPDTVSSFVTNEALNSLCNLSDKTLDKIIHSENKGFSEELNKSKLNDSFEILGIDSFIKPPRGSRLLSVERTLEFTVGERINLLPVLAPYLRNSQIIRIYDRYLRKKETGLLNLLRILDLSEKFAKCEIYTFNYPISEKNNFDLEFDEFKKILRQKYGENRIEVYSSPTNEHRRRILTDDFEIIIDPGLDAINKDFICEKNNFNIQIRKIDK